MYMTPADMLATRLQGSVRQQLLGNGFTCDMRPLALSQNGTKPIITGKGPRAPDKHFSLRALWPQTENFRGTKRQFRGTHRKSTWQTNIHISPNFHCITNKYFENRCSNYNVQFQIQFDIFCDSHLSQRFPRVRACVRREWNNSFTGMRPLVVVPLDRTLRLLSACSPLH